MSKIKDSTILHGHVGKANRYDRNDKNAIE